MGPNDTPNHDHNREHTPQENNPARSSPGGEKQDSSPSRSGDFGPLRSPDMLPQGVGAQELLRQQFRELVAEQFGRWRELKDEQVQRHFVAVLVANVRSDYFEDALGVVEDPVCKVEHRFPQAARLARLIHCCAEFERNSPDRAGVGDLYSLLGDQVVFLKGMFYPRNLEMALEMSATQLPREVHNLADVAELAYSRASELVAEEDAGPFTHQKVDLFERLSRNVVDCINGLKRVRMEMDFRSYGLGGSSTDSSGGLLFGVE